jgi:hypothetical protein
MESLECHISSPVKTICFFKSLLSATTSSLPSRPGRTKLIGVPGSNAAPLMIRPAVPNTWRSPGQFFLLGPGTWVRNSRMINHTTKTDAPVS